MLLKTHRSGSGTLANILYRYGDLNELDFALPKQKTYDFYWPLHFNPSFVDKTYLNSTAPNFLINARHSPDSMESFMPKVGMKVIDLDLQPSMGDKELEMLVEN